MTTEPLWPVFCIDGRDVIVVRDAAEVRIALDPVLTDQPIRLLDAKGRRLRKIVSTPERRRRFFFHYWVGPEITGVEVASDEDCSELLRQVLTAYLSASGVTIDSGGDIEPFARRAASFIE